MNNSNYTLKNPTKYYIWSVKSKKNHNSIYITDKLSPKDFWFQVGQFVRTEITEMELIGHKFVKDHYGTDVEKVYKTTGKFMKKEIIENYNNCDIVKRNN